MTQRYLIPVLVVMMLTTGVCNTLLTKYQDNQCVRNCDDPDPKKRRYFEQPVLQTAQMFVGEMGCWVVVGLISLYNRYQAKKNGVSPTGAAYEAVAADDDENDDGLATDGASIHSRTALNGSDGPGKLVVVTDANSVLRGFGILLLALPSICDILGTTLMNAGLLLVAASIYQMTRGALVLFVGLFSVLFLHRHLYLFQWVSLGGVMLGVAIVGLAGAISPDATTNASEVVSSAVADLGTEAARVIIGVLLIAGAQIFTATQFVLEEWILERSTIEPLRVVGWEGLFGFLVTVSGMIVMHLTIGRTEAGALGYFDIVEGWRQMTADPRILISSLLIMVSIGGFNFFGLSVTRTVSATSRSTIDTCRTLFIWLVSLSLGWESFKWLQVLGFGLLVYFTFLFNGLVKPPFKLLDPPRVEELLPEEPIEHH
ncbi:integral membrane protein [Ophiostoma piceae UAMH 11346]|uniref:Integral membrane protein n=1 Tax=Ophiostoma piceae (strain UAMH 11346) TaxID=1262450 RepID=S3C1G2_OPHP1|nr:integral membrane protein [Ophiostoma piceae UAMH 11346]